MGRTERGMTATTRAKEGDRMRKLRVWFVAVLSMITWISSSALTMAQSATVPGVSLTLNPGAGTSGTVSTVEIIVLLTILSVAPAILIMMTAFTRIVVVLSFVRSALSLQQSPPNQVIIGLALFLTFFVMQPTFSAINHAALQPYLAGKISPTMSPISKIGPVISTTNMITCCPRPITKLPSKPPPSSQNMVNEILPEAI